MKALFFTALLLLMSFPMLANAQDAAAPAPAPAMGKACGADIQKFCPNMAAGPARHQCVVTNASKMSPDCQTAINGMQAELASFRQACSADFRQYCKGLTGPTRNQCVAQNLTQFSAACQAEVAKRPAMTQQQ
jgi:hypothetical protein